LVDLRATARRQVPLTEIWHLVPASSVIGAGIGLAYGAMPGLIMAAVPVSETDAAAAALLPGRERAR
ncbi:hypothetical protein ACFV4N_39845, partial [Actinosynnema sp. NPDC059797]